MRRICGENVRNGTDSALAVSQSWMSLSIIAARLALADDSPSTDQADRVLAFPVTAFADFQVSNVVKYRSVKSQPLIANRLHGDTFLAARTPLPRGNMCVEGGT
jgi:hypothetical protein